MLPPALNHQLAALRPPINGPPPALPTVAAGDQVRSESYRSERSQSPQLPEAEIEEIMIRNRAVSSSAISRAVSDASSGKKFVFYFRKMCSLKSYVDVNMLILQTREKLFVSTLKHYVFSSLYCL